jgi:uncharacterized protein
MRLVFSSLIAVVCLAGCGEDERVGSEYASFEVRGSVEQIHVWNAPPRVEVVVEDAGKNALYRATTDELGSVIFRKVAPGDRYFVRTTAPEEREGPVRVMSEKSSQPDRSLYTGQKLEAGFTYITVRDGTKLAAYITMPGPPGEGPYPTVVNYSGYDPAQPGSAFEAYRGLCGEIPVLCDAPTDASALLAAMYGYATVGVNMRGTACSGGAYDFFEPLQLLDGYDIVETVAAQSWVQNHKVGMTGLSFPGISQLFVAKMHPPSLVAITPLSVIGSASTTLFPGGIMNDGFAIEWATNVLDKAAPYGHGWEQARVDAGDETCKENQLLHAQRVDIVKKSRDNPYYTDDVAAPVDPTGFVDEIDVPVFLASAWQDEQTGPFFFTLLDRFERAPLVRLNVYNGVHPDGFAPFNLIEWASFLDFYVAQRIPMVPPSIRGIAPALAQQIFKVDVAMPPDRFTGFTSFEQARAAYEAEAPLRVVFENGGGAEKPGAPGGTFELKFDRWPPPAVSARRWYFQPDGSLGATAPTAANQASSYELDPEAGQRGILAPDADVWDPLPNYDWRQPELAKAVVFESAPLTEDLVMLGTGSVDLWVKSSVDDADIEVNLSEVRPDAKETYVQSGWLRASFRGLTSAATELWPEHGFYKKDEKALVPGEWTEVRVGIAAFSHVFRKGSRIRIAIDTPGDSRARWRFALKRFPAKAVYSIGHDSARASSLVLPVLGGQAATTPLAPCPSLRAQQCRAHVPYTNTPAN